MAHDLAQDDRAGDDHRRALRLEPGHLAPLRERKCGEPLELSLDRAVAEPMAVHALAVVLDEAEVERRERGDRARDADPSPRPQRLGHLFGEHERTAAGAARRALLGRRVATRGSARSAARSRGRC